MTTWPKPSPRVAEYVRKVKACGHWEYADTRSDRAILRHVTSGQTIAYSLHDGGNDKNGARNFAAEAQATCGCKFVEARNRKPSRKAFRPSGYTPHLDAFDRAILGERDALHADYMAAQERLADLRASDPHLRRNRRQAERIAADLLAFEDELRRLGHPLDQS